MIKAILIDDEFKSLKVLEKEITRACDDVKILALCNSGNEGLTAIELHDPDLIFLDIEMPGINGFEMLKRISNLRASVIFTTAYDQFAIEAFKFSAIDYLLKPIASKDIKLAVERFKKKNYTNNGAINNIEFLLNVLEKQNNRKVVLSTGDGLEVYSLDDIVFCEASSNYTIFHFDKKKVVVSRTLKEYDEMLSKKGFIRIHQSFLVNSSFIKNFNRKENYLHTTNGESMPVSKSRREFLSQSLLKINF